MAAEISDNTITKHNFVNAWQISMFSPQTLNLYY